MRTIWSAAIALVLCPAALMAGGTIKIGDDQSVSVGGGIRSSINFVEDGAPSGNDLGEDFKLDSARLYLSGQAAKGIYADFNTEYDGANVHVLDGLIRVEYSDYFKVWAGRFLPPSDRANLDGPYYMPLWNYPFVSGFPAIFAGRDDGVAAWGQVKGGMFKYQLGAFQGTTGGPNTKDNPLFASRFVLNLRDPEPGYYNSSTYWGSKKIFAVAVTAQTQSSSAGTAASATDFTGLEADVLFEQPTSGGTFTVEGAYYNFDYDNAANASQGSAFYAWAGYLFKSKTGPGQLQPVVRYQSFMPDTGSDTKVLDAAVNYIIAGDNARFHANYSHVDAGGAKHSAFQLGAQVQF